MAAYNPAIHHRKSIRLKGYDYAQEGFYFITICCQDRAQLFGKIEGTQLILNECGEIAHKCWLEIPEHFPNVALHDHIIMPNHVHGIIEIKFKSNHIEKRVLPRSPSKTVGSIVRGFKIGVTKWMRQNTNVYKVWQRNYFDNIIRNEQSFDRISDYIRNNPKKWSEDRFFEK